jgi:hypothetical protein
MSIIPARLLAAPHFFASAADLTSPALLAAGTFRNVKSKRRWKYFSRWRPFVSEVRTERTANDYEL